MVAIDDPKDEFEIRFERARGDIKKLWLIHTFCELNGLRTQDRKLCRAIIKLDPEHPGAREALGHVFYDDQWFPSKKKYETYKRNLENEQAKANGWVRYKEEWMPPADRDKLMAGLVKGADGKWLTEEYARYQSEGWTQFDLKWYSPEDQAKIDSGLFECGPEWVSLEEANAYHADPDNHWTILSPSETYIFRGPLSRERAEVALKLADEGLPHLMRLFGRAPDKRANFVVLPNVDEYGMFAKGFTDEEATELRGLSSIYGAYLADFYFDEDGSHLGAGVAYWDDENAGSDKFGKLYIRHAAGLAFVEALDPSPIAAKKFQDKGRFDLDGYLNEKKIPDWLRYGAASYVERYRLATEQGAEPKGLRKWSVSNVERRGDIDSAATIIAMSLSFEEQVETQKLISEAGLLVAFILDGNHPEVIKAHTAFRNAFIKAGPFEAELKALEAVLKTANAAIVTFAHS